MRQFSKGGLGAVTATSMATSTFPVVIVSVLAAQLIDEFEISRAQVGLLVTGFGMAGAVLSPVFGRLTDRLGGVRSVVGTLTVGAIVLAAMALSPGYGFLAAVMLATGLPNAWGNPATNALIVENTESGDRGVVTGFKQSGVQIGTFLGGILIPIFASLWGWRGAVLAFLTLPLAGLIGMIGRRDSRTKAERDGERSSSPIPSPVRWVAVYGFISGLATQAIVGFLPLFANEDLGWSEQAAGTLVSVVGLAGVAARLMWPRVAESSLGHGRTLRVLAWLTTVTAVLLWLTGADLLPPWVAVPAALFLGGGAIAWNAVGMLAVMDFSPDGLVGKGTGVVALGFLLGLALGPPIMGYSVDTLGSYNPGWIAAATLLFLSGAIASKVPPGSTVFSS